MFDIRADVAKNRLYFTLGEINGNAEREKIVEKTYDAAKQLAPGFTCLSDLRYFRLVDTDDEGFGRRPSERWSGSVRAARHPGISALNSRAWSGRPTG